MSWLRGTIICQIENTMKKLIDLCGITLLHNIIIIMFCNYVGSGTIPLMENLQLQKRKTLHTRCISEETVV